MLNNSDDDSRGTNRDDELEVNRSESDSPVSSEMSYSRAMEYFVDESNKNDEQFESEWTWDTVDSSHSDIDSTEEVDEWYPLQSRALRFPNIFQPYETSSEFPVNHETNEEVYNDDDDLKSELNDERLKSFLNEICPNPSSKELADCVLDYFIYNNKIEIIDTFCKEMHLDYPSHEIRPMQLRIKLRKMINEGNIDDCIEIIEELCPGLINENERIDYLIKKQTIIEMIRKGQMVEPLAYAREKLLSDELEPEKMDELEKMFALMVYDVNDDSPYHYLYSQKEKNKLYNEILKCFYERRGEPRWCRLEMVAREIVFAQKESAVWPILEPARDVQYWMEKSFEHPYLLDEFINSTLRTQQIDLPNDLD